MIILPFLRQSYFDSTVHDFEPDSKEFLGKRFCPLVQTPSHKVEWDETMGAQGMTPAVSQGAKSPSQTVPGVRHRSFEPGYFREKALFGEQDMLKLRKPGTREDLWGEGLFRRALRTLNLRLETRVEWLRWKMLSGVVPLQNELSVSVNYHVPNKPVVSTPWIDFENSDPLDDILNWQNLYFRGTGAKPHRLIFNRVVKRKLLSNTKIRSLIKERFGFSIVTDEALQALLGDFICYDSGYTAFALLTSQVSAGEASFSVSSTIDFSVGDRVTISDGLNSEVNLIDSISGNLITLADNLSFSFLPGAVLTSFKPFIPDDIIIILGQGPRGEPRSDFLTVPSLYKGIEDPRPGKFSVVHDRSEDDPPHLEVIVGLYGLPRLFHPNWHVYAQISSQSWALSWQNAVEVDPGQTITYHLQVKRGDLDFSLPLDFNLEDIAEDPSGTTTYTLLRSDLGAPGTYYWRIRAWDGYNWSSWSCTASFVVE